MRLQTLAFIALTTLSPLFAAEIHIKQATLPDKKLKQFCLKIYTNIQKQYSPGQKEVLKLLNPEKSLTTLFVKTRKHHGAVFIALLENKIRGIITTACTTIEKTLWVEIKGPLILPSLHGRGIGKKLLQQVIKTYDNKQENNVNDIVFFTRATVCFCTLLSFIPCLYCFAWWRSYYNWMHNQGFELELVDDMPQALQPNHNDPSFFLVKE